MSKPTEKPLTDYQAGQLLHIALTGDFKYQTDAGHRVPPLQWRRMIDALTEGDYVEINRAVRLTAKGRQYLDQHHLSIPKLS